MPESREYDVVVIGAGPTGENVADRAVKGGLSAVIVEADGVGGECRTGHACRARLFYALCRRCSGHSGSAGHARR